MKNILLAVFTAIGLLAYSTKDTIRSVETPVPNYDPNGITVPFGDTIVFILEPEHNAREVSEETWTNNDDTALPGGFDVPYGGGEIVPGPGTHYFVCVTHVNMGMKGTINVSLAAVGVYTGPEPVLYPNPADEAIHVDMKNPVQVRYVLTDMNGHPVKDYATGEMLKSLEIPVKDLPKGVYLLTLYGGAGEYRCRVVLE